MRLAEPIAVGGIGVTPFGSMQDAVDQIVQPDGTVLPGSWVAINAEKVIRARRDTRVRSMLEQASLRYPDGMAVVWTMREKGAVTDRIPGVDLWRALMVRAGQQGIPVYLVGARSETLGRVRDRLRAEFGVSIAGATDGFSFVESELIDRIKVSGARIVTVALGSPRQEEFIQRCRSEHPEAFYMGVGGTYDVFAGNVPRAPAWMRHRGLEWLFRLARHPTRVWRYRTLAWYFAAHVARRL